MSFDSVKILDNDFASDICTDFFERFDSGQSPQIIQDHLMEEYGREVLEELDREVLLTALADCAWQVGLPVDDLRRQIESHFATESTSGFWSELYAARKREITAFLRKLQKPKTSPDKPRKNRLPKRIPFDEGDYLLFQRKNGKQVLVVVASVETKGKLKYVFVFPNLSRSSDFELTKRLLDTTQAVSDDELGVFFGKNHRFRVCIFDHVTIKDHLQRLPKFGNRKFNWSIWQCGACGYGVTFADFERCIDDSGSRGLMPEELLLVSTKLRP